MNPTDFVYVVTAAVLFGIGVYGVLVSAHVLRKLLSLNLLGTAVFLMLVAAGSRGEGPDPVPQAMVLTGIVIAVASTGFALALLLAMYRLTGRADLNERDDPEADDD